MNAPAPLLAKSSPNGPGSPPWQEQFLSQHLVAVFHSAQAILDATGSAQLEAFGLDPAQWLPPYRRVVLAAALLHDLGKANDHFQSMLAGKRQHPQGLRHEWVSILLALHPAIEQWLAPAFVDALEFPLALWAIAAHHCKHDRPAPPESIEGAGSSLVVHTSHPEFHAALALIATHLRLAPPPAFSADITFKLVGPDTPFLRLKKLYRAHATLWQDLPARSPWRSLAAAAKAILMASDVAGSAFPNNEYSDRRSQRVAQAFATAPASDDLHAIVNARLAGHSPRPFQLEVAHTPGRVLLVRAGCGSGKTLAAYLRAAHQSSWQNRPLWFCYPTTGTATEGFRDYLHQETLPTEPEAPARRLFHSRKSLDYRIILHTPEQSAEEALLRTESLAAWDTAISACTVDTVLGLLQNQRRPLYAWPAFARSAFVFDEIHAYDDSLFAALLRFLTALPALPILLMTASLPADRLQALRDALASIGDSLAEIDGPADLENLPRYLRASLPALSASADSDIPRDILHAAHAAIAEYHRSGKILWVCNTVRRARRAAQALEALGHPHYHLYHSRYKYPHRVRQHAAVIASFARPAAAAIAITTQVAEMSLDLSATLLITDLAPVPSLIQRLGRLNRRAASGSPACPFIVLAPPHPLPYTQGQLDDATLWLDRLGPGPLSQRHLIDHWTSPPYAPPPARSFAWLDGGPHAPVLSLRDSTPGLSIIHPDDARWVAHRKRSLAECIIPMNMPPASLDWKQWEKCPGAGCGLPVPPDEVIAYSRTHGAEWLC